MCLNVIFFDCLAVIDPSGYNALTREDFWVEYLTAVLLLLTGLLLFVTASAEQRSFQRCVYILGGIALIIGAGEEISWAQRLFGFATPEVLSGLNYKDKFNVHNIIFLGIDVKGLSPYIRLLHMWGAGSLGTLRATH